MLDNECRVRLKLPSGAEVEVRGSDDFVKGETRALLAHIQPNAPTAKPQPPAPLAFPAEPQEQRPIEWQALIEARGKALALRVKPSKNPLETALVLILCSDKVLNEPRPIATQLARWIRDSGHPVERIDRVLAPALKSGDLLASGTKRSRRYELTQKGLSRARQISEKLLRPLSGSN